MYMYAIIGVTLFKNPNYNNSGHLEITVSNPDPYGDLGEAFFTLFRILTAEDWTDLRYNMLNNEHTITDNKNVTASNVPNWIKTFYHVSWIIISSYLLMNLVIGAIVNNFNEVMETQKKKN